MKITFLNDPEGRSDTGALNYARGNRPGGRKSTTWCSADLRTAGKETNNSVADIGWNVKSADFRQENSMTYNIKGLALTLH